jgi:amino acid adenylation domain-containing protein
MQVMAAGDKPLQTLAESVATCLRDINSAALVASPIEFGLIVHLPRTEHVAAGADLVVMHDPGDAFIRLSIHGSFDADAAAAIAQQLNSAFIALSTNDATPMAMVRLGGRDEHALIDSKNTGATASIPEEAVTLSIERQVGRTPQRIALRTKARDWTYVDMWAAVEHRARWLQSKGARAHMRIALCLPRCADLWITALAVLRTGAAYVPLDPSHPHARINEMCADGDVVFVVSDNAARKGHTFSDVTLHCLEDESTVDDALSEHPSPDHLAYIIYTSGSTGAPKGVMVAHRSLQTLFVGLDHALTPKSDAVWLSVTAPTFDPSVPDMMWTLARGHCVAIHETHSVFLAGESTTIAEDILKFGAQRLQCTPSAAAMLLSDPRGPAALAQLDALQVGGEAISQTLARQIKASMRPDAALINIYGPTEITVWISATAIETETVPIDIGRPFANARMHVLAPDGGEQAALAPGELWLGGPSLSLGYWRRAALTQESFIDDPWARGRLYRTGDIVRRGLDGRIIYLGRKDHQVKVRGHRIELAEVERAVAQALQAEAVKVLPRRIGADAISDTHLEAFFTLPAGVAYNEAIARASIEALLPAPMAPRVLVRLDAFPLTPNGKIDRRALLENNAHTHPTRVLAPASDLETQLLAIWRDAMPNAAFDLEDDFFAVGGESLTGARILAKARDVFGVTLGLSAFLEAPSIRQMAALISARGHKSGQIRLTIQRGHSKKRPLFCIHGAGGNVVMFRALAKHLGGDRAIHAFQARGVDTDDEPMTDVSAMSAAYLAALREIDPVGPYCLSGFSSGGVVALDMAQRLENEGANVDLVILFDTLAPWRNEEHVGLYDRIRLAPKASPKIVGRWIEERVKKTFEFSAPPATPELTDIERRSQRVLAAMNRATRRWKPTPYNGAVLLYRAKQARLAYLAAGPTLGWESFLNGRLEIMTIDSDHHGMWDEPAIGMIGQTLEARLQRLDEDDQLTATRG